MNYKSEIHTIENFYATKLDNYRDIYVYVPPSYKIEGNKRYPVLYMHDGQYAFAKSENTGASWNVHTEADRLISQGKIKEILIVAIPNKGTQRGSEYAHDEIPFIKELGLEAKGLLYEDFIVKELKPYIDKNFRTLSDGKNTALMGSSMGGLVTYNIGFRNPNIFSNLAIMSPYFVTIDSKTRKEVKHYKTYIDDIKPCKVWVDIGEYEGLILVPHVREFVDEMLKEGLEPENNIIYYNVPGAAHFEADWSQRIAKPLIYFFGELGKKTSVQLYGRKIAGLIGMKVQLNAVVEYDSGFSMSVLNGNYISEDPDILEVTKEGVIIPKKEGEAKVRYTVDELETCDIITIKSELTELVKLSIKVCVPDYTPEDKPITLNEFTLEKTGYGIYEGEIIVPRDSGFTYKIARGNSFVNPSIEQDKYKKDIPYRRIKASEDSYLMCIVESWKDI